jgi:hypothetical protein
MSWHKFEAADPELAEMGYRRLNGRVCYLATVRGNGEPRIHPVTPFIGQGRLFVFMEPTSPKGKDLVQRGRYALHCGVEDNEGGGGEFYVWGRGRLLTDPESRAAAEAACPYDPAERYILFELEIQRAASTVYTDAGTVRRRWPAK